MIEQTDVAIVGGGPAGLHAAIEACRAGASVTVIDENARLGGQIYRQLSDEFTVRAMRALGQDFAAGRALITEVERLPIRLLTGATVWGWFEPRVLEVTRGSSSCRVEARTVVVATGAYDRPVPIPGWTLPGVMTVGGAQTLVKTQRVLPGQRILLAGTGPLLLVVASQLASVGAHIVAVVDAVPARRVLRHPRAVLAGWRLMRKGVGYHLTLRRARVPWLAPAILVSIDGENEADACTVARAAEDWTPVPGTTQRFDVDTVCLGYGLVPSIELLRACGCRLRYDPRADAWLPERSDSFETSVPGVFAVGDGAGVAGVLVAAEEGRVAGIAAARQLGILSDVEASARMRQPRRRLARLSRFRTAMDDVYRPRPGQRALATPATVVCRCEEVSVRDIIGALDDGADSISQVKAWTRAGMGACQSRMCALSTAHLVAAHLGVEPGSLDPYTARPPVKPVPVSAIVGNTD